MFFFRDSTYTKQKIGLFHSCGSMWGKPGDVCWCPVMSGWWFQPTLMVNILLIMVNIWLMMVNNIFWLVVEPYPSEKSEK